MLSRISVVHSMIGVESGWSHKSSNEFGRTSHSAHTLEPVFGGELTGFHETFDGDLLLYTRVVGKQRLNALDGCYTASAPPIVKGMFEISSRLPIVPALMSQVKSFV